MGIDKSFRRNEGSIWNRDYNPDEDPDILRLREKVKDHPEGELASDLTDEEWLLLLDNDVKTMYKLRGDTFTGRFSFNQNPFQVSHPWNHNLNTLEVEDLTKSDWIRLAKWDIKDFNQKYYQFFRKQAKDDEGNVLKQLDLSEGYLSNAFLNLGFFQ